MRFIKKKQQPQSLIEAKKTIPLPKYGDLDKHVMDDLKHSLLEEQGHICCYCMQRIDFDGMQIEHYKPKDKNKYPELQLDYDNLLGVCKGKTNKNISHCDTLKKNEELKFLAPHENSRKHIIQKLKYTASGEIKHEAEKANNYTASEEIKSESEKVKIESGEIKSEAEEVRDELKDILNLNVEELKVLRKSVIDAVVEMIRKKFKKEGMKKSFIENEIDKANTPKNGKLMPFCQVKIYYLEKKLKQLPK